MASNTTLNPGASGDVIATKERTHDGDATKVQVVTVAGVTGSEGSYTFTDITAGGGVEATALRVTLASDSTGVLSVDDNGGSLTVDGTVAATQSGTWNVGTVTTVTTVSAVTAISNALPAGTNNIGDVDVLSVVPGTGATNLGKAEDAAHSSGDVGVMALAVRQNSQSDLGADGDYVPLTIDDSGGVRVSIVAGAGSGGTATADDADFTAGTTQGTIIQGVYESSPTSVTDGDVGAVGITQTRALKVAIASGGVSGIAEDTASAGGEEGIAILAVRRDAASSGVSADGDFAFLSVDSSGNLRTTGSSGVTSYTEDGASAGGESLVLMGAVRRDTAASSSGTDGDYSTLNTDASGRLHVNVGALPASTNTIEIVGDAAHDAAAAGNPVLVGGYASAAAPSDVSADADAVRAWFLRNGAQATVLTAAGALIGGDATNGIDVDVTRVIPGTSATHLGKAEDAAHASGDTGVMSLAVRTDTAAASSGTTGDYEPFHTDSVGALWTRSTGELADDAAFTAGTSRVLPAGFAADETATDSVDEGDIGAARMTLDRKQIVTPYAHAAAGGCTPYKNLDVDETEDDIKTSAGKLFWLHVMNLHASSVRYLKVYDNVAASVTVGTTTPVLTYPIPANTMGFTIGFGPQGTQFSTGICIAATTGLADNDTGAPGANEVVVNAGYI